jgi:hypothetical protein
LHGLRELQELHIIVCGPTMVEQILKAEQAG